MSEFLQRLIELSTPGDQPDQVRRMPSAAPSGWDAGVKYEPDGRMVVTTPPSAPADNPDAWRELVEQLGQKVPDGWRVVLKEAKYDPAAWTRDDADQDKAVTKAVWRYRFVIEPALSTISSEDLLSALSKKRPKLPELTETGAFVCIAADMQWGKSDQGGSVAALENWLTSMDAALARYKRELKAGRVSEVVIVLPGDCIEGTQSGANRLRRLDLSLTEQFRVYRRTLLKLVEEFALIAPKVTVVVVPGNHDEAIRTNNELNTTYDDSWAVEGAADVADTLAKVGYDHVGFVFPKKDTLAVCIEVAGTVLGVIHGHQTRGKMKEWLAQQALGRQPIGTADLVISGHFHHLVVQHYGQSTWLQAPALESGSQWFDNMNGLSSPKGMVTLIVGEGSWNSLEVV